jgi:hypothetical protein
MLIMRKRNRVFAKKKEVEFILKNVLILSAFLYYYYKEAKLQFLLLLFFTTFENVFNDVALIMKNSHT